MIKLKLLAGGAKSLPPWLDFPSIVLAPHPHSPDVQCIFRISKRDALSALSAGNRQLVFDFWSMIVGQPPPVPNVSRHGGRPALTSLRRAHACFRGIRRPYGKDNDGANVLVYISKPTEMFVYQVDMVTTAIAKDVPQDVVFATYVRLDEPYNSSSRKAQGIISHWGFIEADPMDGQLPVNHASRYLERL